MVTKNNFIRMFIFFVFFLLVKTNVAFTKALPPGSGAGDIPANILILLDKSGSMNTPMTSGTSIWYPYDVAEDSNGKIYVAQNYRSVKKIDYATRVGEGYIGGSASDPNCGNKNSYLFNPVGISIDDDILYVVDHLGKKMVTFNTSGICQDVYPLRHKPWSVTISNGHLWVSGKNYLWTLNLSDKTRDKYCSVHSGMYKRFGIAADSALNYFFATKNRTLIQTKLNATSSGKNYCPDGTRWNLSIPTMNDAVGIDIVPSDDSSVFIADFAGHRLNKYLLTGSSTNPTLTWTVGARGGFYQSTTDASNLKFFYPFGIGTTSSLTHVTQYYASHVQSFNSSGTWQKSIGGAAGTRMKGAKDAITSIVTDHNLTSGANFGFAHWSSGSSGYTGWNASADKGRPCSSNNCLRVRVETVGAAKIAGVIGSISAGGGTDIMSALRIAKKYYTQHSHSPIDPHLGDCQKTYIILIGDGAFATSTFSTGLSTVKNLRIKHHIKTFTIAYGGGIGGGGLAKFTQVAQAGGTTKTIIAADTAALKTELGAAISQIISEKLSFTAPSITATIEEGGSLYQAVFDYVQNQEWQGTITRTKLNPDGSLVTTDADNWSASQNVPEPKKRQIWTVLPGIPYIKGSTYEYNNFHEDNYLTIKNMMELTLNNVGDYHNVSAAADGTTHNSRCAGKAAGVADSNDDDTKGLINFVRGTDYFDYDADCNLTEFRKNSSGQKAYMGDIYHSELVVVGKPDADTAYTTLNQESFWRTSNDYESFKIDNFDREEVIYTGSNSGILHAIDAKTGVEKWGFVPPLIISQMPKMINTNLNKESPDQGGSNAIFGVDGSATAHDMYFKSPYDSSPGWHTVLFVPFGRGGAGFTALDVTDPNYPLHLYTLLNDFMQNRVHHIDFEGTYSDYSYISNQYGIEDFRESAKATENYDADDTVSSTCKTDSDFATNGDTSCFKGSTWTFPEDNIIESQLEVMIDGCTIGDSKFSVTNASDGTTKIIFHGKTLQYSADPGDTIASSEVGVRIKSGTAGTGVLGDPDYDYSALGETWSAPRIIRLPLKTGDVYAAVMGGGFGVQNQGIGSNVHVINLEDNGKLIKRIDIQDLVPKKSGSSCNDLGNDIVNSVPGSPVVITADTTKGINWKGALVYVNDLEGKITKINLTDMTDDGTPAKNKIELFKKTTLFTAESTPKNGRYMYHGMDATIGGKTNNLWLFAGTGNFSRVNDTTNASGLNTENLMIGITDPDFPNFAKIEAAADADDLTQCKDTTTDTVGTSCPESNDRGWYIKLDDYKKVTAEPTVYKGKVYFPIYKPQAGADKCKLGEAYICGVDDECGTNNSTLLGTLLSGEECLKVGKGILSKIVTFADQLYANIAGESTTGENIVQLLSINTAVETFRKSWREKY